MSILIKGMEMPNHCGECGIEWCERWKRLIVAGMPSAKARPEDCPLVPVPPHGRLIDAEKAYEDAITQVSLAFVSNNKEQAAMAVANVIQNAPTVIEAEEGE